MTRRRSRFAGADFGLRVLTMNSLKPMRFIGAILFTAIPCTAILGLTFVAGFTATVSAQDEPLVGPKPHVVVKPMESHIGNITGHGEYGDANGENAVWLDPKPRDFTTATFKCRSTLTGTLPTDQDLFNSIGRG